MSTFIDHARQGFTVYHAALCMAAAYVSVLCCRVIIRLSDLLQVAGEGTAKGR